MASSILTDQALLERYLHRRDEDAFADLVGRHGPMVRATCLRYLGNTPEADDAFQTVFLVLVRKARHIAKSHLLGPWLYTVAVRAARRVLAVKQRTQSRERSVTPMPEPAWPGGSQRNDWLPLLDDALQSLPGKYRQPLILCELEGQSREEAAQNLALPEGTLSSRLARGRNLLRERLLRRSVTVSATALAGALYSQASAAVPPTLVLSTTQAALTGHAAASVAALTQGVVHAMFLSKLKLYAGVFAAVTLVVAGGIFAWPNLSAQDPNIKQIAQDPKTKELEKFQGIWVLSSGEKGGEQFPEKKLKSLKLVVKGNEMKVLLNGKDDHEQKIEIDPSKDPKEINLTRVLNGENTTTLAIYAFDGKTLKICGDDDGKVRPAEFSTQNQPKYSLLVLTRE